MHIKRSVLGVLGMLACILMATFTAGSAQAAPSAHGPADRVLIAPQSPSTAQQKSILATAPGISPSVSTFHVAAGGSYTCPSLTLCTAVWDATTGSYKVFKLYTCAKYALSNWQNLGSYFDNQSSGSHTTFYNSSSGVITSFYPDYTNHNYTWDPVWYIRNC